MAKYKKNQSTVSKETVEEAMKIAKGTQKAGQTKEQTKLIAQGIQKGIEQYKKQHKAKMRELDKSLKQVRHHKQSLEDRGGEPEAEASISQPQPNKAWVPWSLLALTWVGVIAYFLMGMLGG